MKKIIILLLFILNMCVFAVGLKYINLEKFEDKLLQDNFIVEVGDEYERYILTDRTNQGTFENEVWISIIDDEITSITLRTQHIHLNKFNEARLKKDMNILASLLMQNTANGELKKDLKKALAMNSNDSFETDNMSLFVTNEKNVKEIRIEAKDSESFAEKWKKLQAK